MLCPGFVATNIFDGARYQAALDAGDITKTTKNEEASKAAIGMMGGKAGGFLQPVRAIVTAIWASFPRTKVPRWSCGQEEVADMVFASISEQELYILPHYDSTITAVEGRAETILARAVPALQGIAALQAARKAAGKDEAQVNDEAKARL